MVPLPATRQGAARPALGREAVVDSLNEVIVVPATRTVRGLASEVVLTLEDGMPATCALNFDHITLVQRSRLGATITSLKAERWAEARAAMLVACGFEPGSS